MASWFADLHLHSSYSDGKVQPAELVREAKKAGLQALSLTDHDTLAGISEARDEARRQGLEFIPGLELSLALEGRPLHLLAYGELEDRLEVEAVLRVNRSRNKRFLGAFCLALRESGVDVHEDELQSLPVRAAFQALKVLLLSTRKGQAQDLWKEARKKAGAEIGPRLDGRRVLKALSGPGILGVWAHPLASPSPPLEFLSELRAAGLRALEVQHGRHDDEARARLRTRAGEFGLVVTGGSDCHFRPGWPRLGDGGLSREEFLIFKRSLG